MLKVPGHFFSVSQGYQLMNIREMTFVSYNHRKEQTRNEVFLAEHAVIFVEGGKKLLHMEDKVLEIQKGQAIFLKRGCYFLSENFSEEQDYKSLMFFFNERLARAFVEANKDVLSSAGHPRTFPLVLDTTPVLQNYIQSVLLLSQYAENQKEKFLKLKFHELLLHLIAGPHGNEVKALLRDIYLGNRQDLEFFMEDYFLKPLSVEELARLSGRSTSGFKREFQEKFRMPPGQWIRQRRLQHAAFLLKNSDKTVSDVAYETGFESISHFIKTFKEAFGHTPGTLNQKQ